ncbi:MAG: DUF4358 domain-containing protein [Bacilli bacterium]
MKKILLFIITLLCITGCGSTKIDLEKVKTNLNNLTYNDDKMFANTYIDSTLLNDKYGFDTKNIEEFVVCMSNNVTTSSMYAIFLPKNEQANEDITNFIKKYKAGWSMGYFPAEEKLVTDMKETKIGDYLVYIVSHDNEKVLETIKQK